MTPANKKTLIEFVGFAKAPTGAQANFSNALAEAFRLLANSEAGDDMQPGDVRRGLWSPEYAALFSFYFANSVFDGMLLTV